MPSIQTLANDDSLQMDQFQCFGVPLLNTDEIHIFNRIDSNRWSEYTLYRTALDHLGVFDNFHATGPTTLLGETSVWFSEQFEAWNVTAAFDGEA